MSLLENPTSYNLSDSKFSLGVAIFDTQSEEFVDLHYFRKLVWTQTSIESFYRHEYIKIDYKPCNTSNGDFAEINLNAKMDRWKQG